MFEKLFLDGFTDILRIAVAAPVLYVAAILFIRLTGKRSISKMNSFDWIVTVALGSILASGAMLDDVTILETLWAMALLFLLQWLLTKTVARWKLIRRVVKASPRLLYYDGDWCDAALDRERITREEVLSAARQRGFARLEEVLAVILETEGELSVVDKKPSAVQATPTACRGVVADQAL